MIRKDTERMINVLKDIAVKANVRGIECEAMDVALDAIKQQIPQKAKIVITEYFGCGGSIHPYNSTYCPCCNASLDFEDDNDRPIKFCYNCGKAIDRGED